MLQHPDREPTDQVHQRDDHARHRLAADEPARAVHAGEEIGLPLQFEPQAAGLLASDRAGGNIGVDRHLPARQAVEREAGRHFAGAGGTGRDDDELDDGDDREDHASDHDVVGRHELAEGLDHLACGAGAVDGGPRKNQPCGRDVEHEPDERSPE